MRHFLLLGFLALAGCSTTSDVHGPKDHFEYGAISHDPFWIVSVGDQQIVLTRGPSGGRADGELTTVEFPRTLPVETESGVRRWESGQGSAFISLEARPGPCTTGGRTYADTTRVIVSGQQQLRGCGGPEMRGTAAQ